MSDDLLPFAANAEILTITNPRMKKSKAKAAGSKSAKSAPAQHQGQLSAGAHALASIGPITETVVTKYCREGKEPDFFAVDQDSLKKLASALQDWNDQPASGVVETYIERAASDNPLDIDRLLRWVRFHTNDSESVHDCISVEAPAETEIICVRSRSGSQKLVFLATWRDAQRQVVLKRPLEPGSIISKRESQSHPLSLAHPNIIATHTLWNAQGEEFFAEEYIPDTLNDEWRANVQEAGNLLHDIADALAYLHKPPLELVHGDVKPDNIAKKDGRYILLDFGICRPAAEFKPEVTATGSLRTRAPELLTRDSYSTENVQKVDVWALGATVYNALVGRFPLIKAGEPIPRISKPAARKGFEEELAQRVRSQWSDWVVLDAVDSIIRPGLEMALEHDPAKRATAADLMEWAQGNLSAFLRNTPSTTRFSPLDEIAQLHQYLPGRDILRSMPITAKETLRNRLTELRGIRGLESAQQRHVQELLERLT